MPWIPRLRLIQHRSVDEAVHPVAPRTGHLILGLKSRPKFFEGFASF